MLLENGNATDLNGHVQVQSVKLIEEGLFTYERGDTSSVDSTCFHWSSDVFLSSFTSAEDAIAAMLSFAWIDRRSVRALNG